MGFFRSAIFCLLAFTFQGCQRTPSNEAHERVLALIQAGHTEEALQVVNAGLRDQGDDAALLNDRVALLLLMEDREARREALETLKKLRSLGVGHAVLYEHVRHSSKIARLNVAKILGQLEDSKSLKHLHRLAEDTDPEVRAASVCSLGKLKDPKSKMLLCIRLKDADWKVRGEAADALAALGDCSATPFLLQRANDPDAYVRMKVQSAILQLAAPAQKAVYEKTLGGEVWPERITAALALTKIGQVDPAERVLLQALQEAPEVDRALLAEKISKMVSDAQYDEVAQMLSREKDTAVGTVLAGYFDRREDEKSQRIAQDYHSKAESRR